MPVECHAAMLPCLGAAGAGDQLGAHAALPLGAPRAGRGGGGGGGGGSRVMSLTARDTECAKSAQLVVLS